jgi:hypothetical protein
MKHIDEKENIPVTNVVTLNKLTKHETLPDFFIKPSGSLRELFGQP